MLRIPGARSPARYLSVNVYTHQATVATATVTRGKLPSDASLNKDTEGEINTSKQTGVVVYYFETPFL